jgi:hypothetical protein
MPVKQREITGTPSPTAGPRTSEIAGIIKAFQKALYVC